MRFALCDLTKDAALALRANLFPDFKNEIHSFIRKNLELFHVDFNFNLTS